MKRSVILFDLITGKFVYSTFNIRIGVYNSGILFFFSSLTLVLIEAASRRISLAAPPGPGLNVAQLDPCFGELLDVLLAVTKSLL